MATTLTKKEEIGPFFDRFFDLGDPFTELTSVRRRMNSLLDSVMRPDPMKSFSVPAIDLYARDGTYTVEVALPGVEKKDIDIEIDGNYLTVSGSFAKTDAEDNRYHYRELRRGEFSRSVTFPNDIDPAQVSATFDRGVLKIAIPSLRPALSQKVAIK